MLQLALQIDLPAARPLVPVEACMVLCDADEDEILRHIEDGSLAWAFNIGEPTALRREIRVWRDALLKVLRRQDTPMPATPEEVISRFLPQRDLRTSEIQRLFSCSSQHVHDLMRTRCLIVARAATAASGPNAAALITRASVQSFLLRGLVR